MKNKYAYCVYILSAMKERVCMLQQPIVPHGGETTATEAQATVCVTTSLLLSWLWFLQAVWRIQWVVSAFFSRSGILLVENENMHSIVSPGRLLFVAVCCSAFPEWLLCSGIALIKNAVILLSGWTKKLHVVYQVTIMNNIADSLRNNQKILYTRTAVTILLYRLLHT